jgi:hypothetical protein
MSVIPVDRAVDKKRIIRKNGRPRRRRGTRGRCTPPPPKKKKDSVLAGRNLWMKLNLGEIEVTT